MSDEKHTPTPWKVEFDDEDAHTYYVMSEYMAQPGCPELECWIGRGDVTSLEKRKANAEFIVTAVNEHAQLKARIDELEKENAVLKHDMNETHTKVIPGLIKFAREGRLEEYITAFKLRLNGII